MSSPAHTTLTRSQREVRQQQARDTGMALTLLMLLSYAATGRDGFVRAAIAFLVVAMTVPMAFRPASIVWFGLSHALGAVTSKIVLGAVFFLVVTPIGLVRRLLGYDALRLRAFKAGDASVMHTRNHLFSRQDLERPF